MAEKTETEKLIERLRSSTGFVYTASGDQIVDTMLMKEAAFALERIARQCDSLQAQLDAERRNLSAALDQFEALKRANRKPS